VHVEESAYNESCVNVPLTHDSYDQGKNKYVKRRLESECLHVQKFSYVLERAIERFPSIVSNTIEAGFRDLPVSKVTGPYDRLYGRVTKNSPWMASADGRELPGGSLKATNI